MKNRYNYGNTARKIDIRTEVFNAPTHQVLREIEGEKRRQKKMNMGFLYVTVLLTAFVLLCQSLISYIKLQSEINASVDRISVYEQRLNNLTLANDDEYSKMINAINFDEIKQVAIEELGMVYASKDQIITYTKENSDKSTQISTYR